VALAADGSAWAWGWNGFGQLGDGTTAERHAPVRVAGGTGILNVAAGPYHSLAVDSSGNIRAWGWNALAQLGDGTAVDRHVAVTVRPSGDGAAVIAGGVYHSLAA
jgi:alpha-tubulin suppressor-like RCC1 family protein